jgi:hypothetical protein
MGFVKLLWVLWPFFSHFQKFRPERHKHNKVQLYDLINPNVLIKTRFYPITQVLITYKYPRPTIPTVRRLQFGQRSLSSVTAVSLSLTALCSSHTQHITVISLVVSVLVSLVVVCLHFGSLTRYFPSSLPLNSVRSLPPWSFRPLPTLTPGTGQPNNRYTCIVWPNCA